MNKNVALLIVALFATINVSAQRIPAKGFAVMKRGFDFSEYEFTTPLSYFIIVIADFSFWIVFLILPFVFHPNSSAGRHSHWNHQVKCMCLRCMTYGQQKQSSRRKTK